MSRLTVLIAALTCLLSACSGFKAYRNNYERNLFITTETETRGLFSGVAASLDIYRIQGDCSKQYEGTVELGNSLVEVGIPIEELAVLVFRFESSAFLSNSHSSMGYDVTLNPLSGYTYDVSVTYRDNIYNVEVYERMPGGAERQEMLLGSADTNCSSET